MSVHLPNPETDYYWNLTLKDGRTLPIPPVGVAVVQRKINEKAPIHTRNEMIPFSEVKGFEKTSRRFTDVKLLEDTARAFKEPVVTDEGAVKARWVKKHVSQSEYDKYYAKSIMYKYLTNVEGMVAVALLLPVHMIDPSIHEPCTPEEEKRLG
jgi:hypothetical protein